jgi:hypothetical protein
MLDTTCAPCGTGKDPIGASTLIVSAGLGAAEVVCDAAGAGEDAVRLAAGEEDVAGGALVIPAVQAVTDRPAAQVVTAMAIRRCMFNRCLSVSRVAATQN